MIFHLRFNRYVEKMTSKSRTHGKDTFNDSWLMILMKYSDYGLKKDRTVVKQ